MSSRGRIALLIDTLSGDYEQLLREAVVREVGARGLRLSVLVGGCPGAPGADAAAWIYSLVDPSSFDGAIVVSSRLGLHLGARGLADFCRSLRTPRVCSVGVALPGVPSIVVDNRAGMRNVVGHLASVHGARRVAFIGGPAASAEAADRMSGYRAALEEQGLQVRPELMVSGDFTVASGRAAMEALAGAGLAFDAVVAANDAMAFGAMDVLRAHGRRVPNDVLVAGFDDARASRFTRPALTTAGQPFNALGAHAVGCVVRQIEGKSVEPLTVLDVHAAVRRSCGCGARQDSGPRLSGVEAFVSERRPTLAAEVRVTIEKLTIMTKDSAAAWGDRLVVAAEEELAEGEGVFLRELEALLEEADEYDDALEHLQALIATLRRHLSERAAAGGPGTAQRLEDVWHEARVRLAAASTRAQGRKYLQAEAASFLLRRSGGRLSTALSLPGIRAVLAEELPAMGVANAAVSLRSTSAEDAEQHDRLEPWFALRAGAAVDVDEAADVDAERFVSPDALGDNGPETLVAMPLTFGDRRLGVVALELGQHTPVYEMVRDQLSAALQSTFLHEGMVAETKRRERLEREHLEEEAKLAQRIQTAILPEDERIAGLEISAAMVPAASVGGDYYDVLPFEGGGWIGIGDVTGHGLRAGLIMLMMQSAIAAAIARDPGARPSDVLRAANQVMTTNTRRRVKLDDYMTIVLLRVERDGSVTYAGAHEPILVHRARTRQCELVETEGLWLGIRSDVSARVIDRRLQLEDGDLLVLHTDGVTEARNAHGEAFGVDRLSSTVSAAAHLSPSAVQERVVQSVTRWTSSVDDDVTVLVARYRSA